MLSDLLMPRMGGQELHRQVRQEQIDTRFVCISGFTNGTELASDVVFLGKPPRAETLYAALERALESGRPGR
ncbi:MAG: hypothetical protein HC897_16330 [Thermoanaerobaculia bacterium]|nr:hypothetical protein [Thermoanaerobaculia bacterium]